MDIPRTAKRNEKRLPKETFFSGVLILTISNLLVKVLGMFFKIPMNYIMGDTGMGYYNAAYTIYTFFYMLSTAGLPTAVSVMTAETKAAGEHGQSRRILYTALLLFGILGTAGTAVLAFLPEEMASAIGAEPAAVSIITVAPALLFICISSAFRGYFQGCSRMMPTAISQLLEALCKTGAGILGALYAIRRNEPPHIVAAYAILGLTIGSAVSMLYLLAAGFHGRRETLSEGKNVQPTGAVINKLAAIALPITLSSAVMSLTGMIDTVLLQRLLQNTGMPQEAATTLYGNYTSLAVPMFNLPPVLVYPIAYALVPVLSACHTKGDERRSEKQQLTSSALRISVLIGAPCAFGLTVLSEPILKLLYREASAESAAPLLTLLAPSSLFVCVLAITNAVLQSVGKAALPMYSMLTGAAAKSFAVWVLVPHIGIAAAPVSTCICYVIVTAMNLYFMMRCTGASVRFADTFLKPFAAAAVCAVSAYGMHRVFRLCLPDKAAVLPAIAGAAVVYLLCVKRMRILHSEDLVMLPGSRRIRKWLDIE